MEQIMNHGTTEGTPEMQAHILNRDFEKAWAWLHDTDGIGRSGYDQRIQILQEIVANHERFGLGDEARHALHDKISALKLMREFFHNEEFKAYATAVCYNRCRELQAERGR